jgi:Putative polyhydroxyalkanoic acid system protein (PHA_gran_rgn)
MMLHLETDDVTNALRCFCDMRPSTKEDLMPGFRTEVPHTLSKDDATEKLKAFLDKVRERYKDQVSSIDGAWNENILEFSLSTFGFKITGVLTVEDQIAVLEGQLPFAAVAFRGKIEQGIKAELVKALA